MFVACAPCELPPHGLGLSLTDISLTESSVLATRAATARKSGAGDTRFRLLALAAALAVLLIFAGVFGSLLIGAAPAFKAFGFGFITSQAWRPTRDIFGALGPIYGTLVTSVIAMVIAVPVGIGVAIFLTELCPRMLRRPIGIAVELLAGIPSIIYGIWGLFVFAPWFQLHVQEPMVEAFDGVPLLGTLFGGPAYGIGIFTAGLILSIMILPFISAVTRDVLETVPSVLKEASYGLGSTQWEVMWKVALPFSRNRRGRRRHAGAGPGAGRNHGRHLRDRKCPSYPAFALGAGNLDLRRHRQRVRRGDHRALYLVADLSRAGTLCHHLHRAGGGAADVAADGTEGGQMIVSSGLYLRRRIANIVFIVLSLGAALFGLVWLAFILGALLINGVAAISPSLFILSTPPPGSPGGLANAIVGSLMMSLGAVALGTPIGLFAGTYLAEYARFGRLAFVVRFVNDILLSTPSIITGLFIYELVVVRMHHFSAIAGALSWR